MDNSEFVFTQTTDEEGNKIIVGGGYKIESYFLKSGQPIMTTYNNENELNLEENTFDAIQQNGGKKVSSPFENLAVPAGIFYVNQKVPKSSVDMKTHYDDNHNMLPDDIYDKLLALVQPSIKKPRKTRKNNLNQDVTEKIQKRRKTRRNK
jgi:hypothetical protein